MAKMTKTKKKTRTTTAAEREKLMNKIYKNIEDMLELFSSSAAENYSNTQLNILAKELTNIHNLFVTILHVRLKKLSVTASPRKKAAARRR